MALLRTRPLAVTTSHGATGGTDRKGGTSARAAARCDLATDCPHGCLTSGQPRGIGRAAARTPRSGILGGVSAPPRVLAFALVALLASPACGVGARGSGRATQPPSNVEGLHLLVWTPVGLVVLDDLDAAEGRSVHWPELLRQPPTDVRQLPGGRLVAIVGRPTRSAGRTAPDRPGRLVVVDPAAPESTLALGPAHAWFPGFDGDSVWRVRQLAGGPASLDAEASFEVQHLGIDGAHRGAALALPPGLRPVAATRTGLAVEQPAPPGRPYPPGEEGKPHTAIGGVVRDLVEVDLTGKVIRELSAYTAVVLAGTAGHASVTSSDPNAPAIRPTEVIDLSSGLSVSEPAVELAYRVFPQPRTETRGGAVAADLSGPQELHAVELASGRRWTLTKALPPDVPDDAFEGQDATWSRGVLLLAEVAEGGVRVAAWTPPDDEILRGSAILPAGSFPLALLPP